MSKVNSAGVIITNGIDILLCHSTNNKHWDIPKGKIDQDESNLTAALRELKEETSITLEPSAVSFLGKFDYTKKKNLFLWLHLTNIFPDISTLDCITTFTDKNGRYKKEIDAYRVVNFDLAQSMVVPNLWKVLCNVRLSLK